LEGGGRTRNRGESEEKERVTESKRGRILTQMKAIEASSRRQVARVGSMLDTARQTWNPGDLSCHQAHMSNISQQARTHGCMTGRSTAQNTARRNVPRPLPLYSMHEQLRVQHARTATHDHHAKKCGPCCSAHANHAPRRFQRRNLGVSPCLVRPPARPVLVLLQHARVAAFPGSALLGAAVNRACNGAARARDGRLRPAPAMGAARARDRLPRPGTALLVTAAMCARDRRIPRLAACCLRACYCAEDRTKT
jgi:hypothetical protein